ncbi:membrane protein insertion efficiency factor YidD [Polaribacter cellanae]|uniref:Membrane protein insertion efficiency factor YidD n=1 Tax=Polaribacter cellanae TaxID=2818493 RepID=A0A975CNW9_9FLAO|nr:membrane protein insertion efficiency factor YidD [Polaribacter cellanae]QTE22675.1 membrane protein insertion efficiency factor YidD [Polaribacter cellanae]
MKIIILNLIKLYWFFKPKKKSAKCIFRKNCSNYIYDKTFNEGFISGIKALKFRINNCKYGFELFVNPTDNKTYMILPNKDVINEKEIAERLL